MVTTQIGSGWSPVSSNCGTWLKLYLLLPCWHSRLIDTFSTNFASASDLTQLTTSRDQASQRTVDAGQPEINASDQKQVNVKNSI